MPKSYSIEVSGKGEGDEVYIKYQNIGMLDKEELSKEVGKAVMEAYNKGYNITKVIIKKQ